MFALKFECPHELQAATIKMNYKKSGELWSNIPCLTLTENNDIFTIKDLSRKQIELH